MLPKLQAEIDAAEHIEGVPKGLGKTETDLYDLRHDRWKEDLAELSHRELLDAIKRSSGRGETVDISRHMH